MMIRRIAGLSALIAVSAFGLNETGFAASAPVSVKGVKPITSIEGITEYGCPTACTCCSFPIRRSPASRST